MIEEVRKILLEIVEEDYPTIPEYAFTITDYVNEAKKKGNGTPSRSTALRNLDKRVDKGELKKIKTSREAYFVPISLAKNAEIDEQAVLSA